MYLNSRWCCLISQFIVSSLSSEFHILMSYRVLIEWMNIHLENCLCSSFCQEHCGILKFPGATKLQYSISRIYSIYGRSYKQGACSTPGMQALCLFFNYLCSFIFFSLQFLSLFLPRITYNIMKSENVSSSVMSDSLWPYGCSLPGSSVHRILQARLLEWVAISCFGGSSRPRDQTVCLLHWQAGSLPLAPPRKPQQAHLSAHKSGNGLNISKVTCPL